MSDMTEAPNRAAPPVSEERRVALEELRAGASAVEVARKLVGMGMLSGDARRLAEKLDVRYVRPHDRRIPPLRSLLKSLGFATAYSVGYGLVWGALLAVATTYIAFGLPKYLFITLFPLVHFVKVGLLKGAKDESGVPVPLLRTYQPYAAIGLFAAAAGILVADYVALSPEMHHVCVERVTGYGTAFRPFSGPMVAVWLFTMTTPLAAIPLLLWIVVALFIWKNVKSEAHLQ
ncbi:MAG TPA: hypothetical protein VGM37_19105 [Armatimonadota bacterium]|jgi:hypothetical protein